MYILFLCLSLVYEEKIDSIYITVPPDSEVVLNIKNDKIKNNNTLPLWIERAYKKNLKQLSRRWVVKTDAKKVTFFDFDKDGVRDILFLRGNKLFVSKGLFFIRDSIIFAGITGFGIYKNKIFLADKKGNIKVLGDKTVIGTFKPPVQISGGERLFIIDGDNRVFEYKKGFFGTSIKSTSINGFPVYASGIIFTIKDRQINPGDGMLPEGILPSIGKINGKESLIFPDKMGRIYFASINKGKWRLLNGDYKTLFPDSLPPLSSFAMVSPDTLIIISTSGNICFYYRRGENWIRKVDSTITEKLPMGTISIVRSDSSSLSFLFGTERGAVFANTRVFPFIGKRVDSVSSYASPAPFKHKIIIGTGKGTVRAAPFDAKVVPPARVATGDLNGDNKEDVVIGAGNGKLHLFLSPEFCDDSTSFPLLGEFLFPVIYDMNNDGLQDIIISNIDGEVIYFRNKGDGNFEEEGSWSFKDGSIQDYYSKYLNPGIPFTVDDTFTVSKIKKLINRTPKGYLDEVCFTIGFTPPEVLRAMALKGDIDIILNNAKDVYRAADELPYVQILERGNYTTLLYDGKYELPADIYYFYVVHPRILYEIPARIDVSYWSKPNDFYDVPYEDWLRKDVDIYSGKEGKFWRDDYFVDKKYGKTILEVGKEATNLRDAIINIHKFLSWAYKGNFMRFGYKTQDIQPLQIFYKAYGSCGEQSILLASISRTLLIPNYIVIDRGEDHQWNHFWYPEQWSSKEPKKCMSWHHWDINGKAEDHIGNPPVSAERMKKNVSTVVAWRPDGYQFDVTECGYTPTGALYIFVKDKSGQPIPGALVVLRSHWRGNNTISDWKYSGVDGSVLFKLGFEPGGYSIDVLTPYGAGGKKIFYIKEGETDSINILIPAITSYRKFTSEKLLPDSIDVKHISSFVRVRNFITSSPYRISSPFLKDSIEYTGTGEMPWPVKGDKFATRYEGKKIYITNPDRMIFKRILVTISHRRKSLPPMIKVSGPDSVMMGKKARFILDVKDNLGVKNLYVEINNKKITLNNRKSFIWDTGRGGPISPGKYRLIFSAVDYGGNISEFKKIVKVLPARSFVYQKIYQDTAPDSLPSGSWVYGPIKINNDIPFIFFKTEAPGEHLDLDIFLYRDKNNDGRVTSKELVKSSTSPTDREKIILWKPKKGVYYFYANGCTVENDSALFNLETSFVIDSTGNIIR